MANKSKKEDKKPLEKPEGNGNPPADMEDAVEEAPKNPSVVIKEPKQD